MIEPGVGRLQLWKCGNAFIHGGIAMKFRTLRLLSIPALLLTLAMSVGACNTIEGLGEDTAAAGEEVEETAEEARQ